MWTCPKCGSQVDPSFDVCWSCGTTPEGVEDPTFVKADDVAADESPVDLDMPKGEEPLPELPEPLAGELVECYWALDLMQAKFLADQLTDQGIPAIVRHPRPARRPGEHELRPPRLGPRRRPPQGPRLARSLRRAEQGRARPPRCVRLAGSDVSPSAAWTCPNPA